MANISAGRAMLSALISDDDAITKMAQTDLKDEYLLKDSEKEALLYIKQHTMSYGQVPNRDTVKTHTGLILPEDTPEPFEYYLDEVVKRYLHANLRDMIQGAGSALNDGQSPSEVMLGIEHAVNGLRMTQGGTKVYDFAKDAHDLLKAGYTNAWTGNKHSIMTGWEHLDSVMGGLTAGDFMGIVGRPAAGKTYLMLYMALNCWAKQKKPPLFLSMEMAPELIMQRITAMYLKVPVTPLKLYDLPTVNPTSGGQSLHDRIFTGLKGLQDESDNLPLFHIADGNLAATVDDIIMLVQQLKPSCVFIDGAYLLKHPDPKKVKWDKIGDNAENLKKIVAGELKTPVVASYQLNKDAVKATKKGDNVGLEHIAGADVIGQIASVVLGLMQEDSVETLASREVRILKGRSGESGKFDINWIFDEFPYMDFSQRKTAGQQQDEEDKENANAFQDLDKPILKHLV